MTIGFWRSVASVLTGTALAQLIPVLGSLIIARQFSPAEFGIFAAWLGVVLLVSVVMTGRLETALAIETDGEPRRLAVLSIFVTAVLAAVTLGVVLIVFSLVAPLTLDRVPSALVLTLVPTALSLALAQTLQSWAAAEGQYRKLSQMRIAQAGAVTLVQIVAGAFHPMAETLAFGQLLGVIAGFGASVHLMPIGAFPVGKVCSTISDFWHRRKHFILYGLPAGSIGTAASQLPVFIVTTRFGADIGGLLALTMRVMGAPIGLLGKSVLDVFKRHAATSFAQRGDCREEYVSTAKVLASAALILCGVITLGSEQLFAMAFGEAWRASGTIAFWLLPVFALGFMASPLSYMVFIAGKQHWDLIWQIVLLGLTLACLGLPDDGEVALKIYGVTYGFHYLIYLAMSYRFSMGDK